MTSILPNIVASKCWYCGHGRAINNHCALCGRGPKNEYSPIGHQNYSKPWAHQDGIGWGPASAGCEDEMNLYYKHEGQWVNVGWIRPDIYDGHEVYILSPEPAMELMSQQDLHRLLTTNLPVLQDPPSVLERLENEWDAYKLVGLAGPELRLDLIQRFVDHQATLEEVDMNEAIADLNELKRHCSL